MLDWFEEVIELAAKQKDTRKPWLDGYSPVFIYGTGTFAQDVHRVLLENGLPVYGFLDHMGRETPLLLGMPVYTPEKAAQSNIAPERTIVVLGILNYQADIPRITERLTNAGFCKILTAVDLYDLFGRELGIRYWLTNRDFYFPMQSILEEMQRRWADESSRTVFRAVMEFRLTGDAARLPIPDLANPYHPTDLPAWKLPLRFVDCGAFDGDTLAGFAKNRIKIHSVAAFEPDPVNFAKLSHYVRTHQGEFVEANLFPCGVYSSTVQLAFESGGSMASSISKHGTTIIQCVALDDAIPTFAPNLIKMDIEGAEYDALLGARHILNTYTPGLAISLYHRPEHLWQLPILVENIAPEKYRFYVRSHARNDFELVLYAIPMEQKG